MNKLLLPSSLAALLLLSSCARNSHPQPGSSSTSAPVTGAAVWPGKKPDGSVLLPNQWSLRPVGQQIELGDLPINVAVHPNGRFAAVLHSGYGKHQVIMVDLQTLHPCATNNLHECFYGIEFSRDGKSLFCSGASDEVIHAFDFQDGQLVNAREIKLRERKQKAIPAGLVVNNAATRLFVANVWGDRISQVELSPEARATDIVLGTNGLDLRAAPVIPSSNFDVAAAEKRALTALY